jgi:Ca-activated chloride channel family protein
MLRAEMSPIKRYTKMALLLPGVLALAAHGAVAASLAGKNSAGNRLFSQGKFQEAEKAYLYAQLEAPGRPELLYNLGNALVKQKKYDKAIQSLRQAVSKGDRGLQASGWYNLGNALFESGSYQDAAQAYIQALHINPADRDTKHNLELAWKKLQEQKQNPGNKSQSQDQQNKTDSAQDRQQNQGDSKKREKDQGKSPQREQDRKQAPESRPSQAERREAPLSREQALQILDAMKNQELAEKHKLLERLAKRATGTRDW